MTQGLCSSFASERQWRHNTEAALTYLGHIDFRCDAVADWPILNLYYKKNSGQADLGREEGGYEIGESRRWEKVD